MRILDQLPTGRISVRWVDSKTRNPVVIGYCDGGPRTTKKNVKKSSPIPHNFYLKYKR
jgi:hypothetical protein